ncbi:hypothetical protein [Bradyrhizobium sp. 2TAF24]|uniref:hypothetical protein n=1 Tax=Bradyrhizobium sp. 2TAF24 TaxID=3233011 RepID=UPI003F934090
MTAPLGISQLRRLDTGLDARHARSMKPTLPGLLPISLIMLTAVLVVWLGFAGPLISETDAKGWLAVVEKWQTLIGVLGAFGVGYLAVRPVWRQVRIQGAQAAMQMLPVIEQEHEATQRDFALLSDVLAVLRNIDHMYDKLTDDETYDDRFSVAEASTKTILDYLDNLHSPRWEEFVGRLTLTRHERVVRQRLHGTIKTIVFPIRELKDGPISYEGEHGEYYEDDSEFVSRSVNVAKDTGERLRAAYTAARESANARYSDIRAAGRRLHVSINDST